MKRWPIKRQVKASVGRAAWFSAAESAGEMPTSITPSASFQGLVDVFTTTGLLAALSVGRRLNSAYTGSLIRVRRSSDNAEQDIGYIDSTTAVLNTVALADFVGADNAFITTVYDQSGNARDWLNATAASQPQIVSAGAVMTMGPNNRPGALFSNHQLKTGSFAASSGQVAVFFAWQRDTNSAYEIPLRWGNPFTTTFTWHIESYNQTVTWRPRSGTTGNVVIQEWNSATATFDLISVGVANLATGFREWSNNLRGTLSATGGSFTATATVFGPRYLITGREDGGGNPFVGNVGECILYNVAARASASAGIATNMNAFWGSTA